MNAVHTTRIWCLADSTGQWPSNLFLCCRKADPNSSSQTCLAAALGCPPISLTGTQFTFIKPIDVCLSFPLAIHMGFHWPWCPLASFLKFILGIFPHHSTHSDSYEGSQMVTLHFMNLLPGLLLITSHILMHPLWFVSPICLSSCTFCAPPVYLQDCP